MMEKGRNDEERMTNDGGNRENVETGKRRQNEGKEAVRRG